MRNTGIHDYTSGNIVKQMLIFSAPFVLSNFLQTFYNLVDMMFIGQYVGQVGLSSVSIGGDILHFFTFMSVGFTSAGQIILSQYVGKREYNNVGKTIGTFTVFFLSLAAVCMVIGFAFSNTFLDWMQVPEAARQQALSYTLVCFSGLIFIFGYNSISAIFRGIGDSRTPFIFVLIATMLNIILDYVFIVLCDLAAVGAALGTVIGQAVAFICSVVYFIKKRNEFGFEFRPNLFVPDKKIILLILKMGIPLTIQTCSISISNMVVNSFINGIGLVQSAVNGVANKVGNIASIVTVALNQAGASMLGQNYAAGKLDRVKKIMAVVGVCSIIFSALLSVILALTPEGVFGLFNSEPEVLELAPIFVVPGIIMFASFALRAPFLSLMNGQGFVMMSFTVGLLDGVVLRIGFAVLLGIVLEMGLTGFWIGNALSGMAVVIVGGLYFLSGKWKHRKLAIK